MDPIAFVVSVRVHHRLHAGAEQFLLASSGSQFGLRRTWHHILGIRIGVSGLILLSAAGVGVLVQAYPLAYSALKYFGFIYMSWLAIKLILAGGNLNKAMRRSHRH